MLDYKNPIMNSFTIELIGILAGILTSIGFIPQLIKGYKTKQLDDISYYMPMVLAVGMFLWLTYGLLIRSIAVVVANAFSIISNLTLVIMKKKYSKR